MSVVDDLCCFFLWSLVFWSSSSSSSSFHYNHGFGHPIQLRVNRLGGHRQVREKRHYLSHSNASSSASALLDFSLGCFEYQVFFSVVENSQYTYYLADRLLSRLFRSSFPSWCLSRCLVSKKVFMLRKCIYQAEEISRAHIRLFAFFRKLVSDIGILLLIDLV